MERKFESEIGKRIQEGKKRDSTINYGIVSVAVVAIALLVGSATFLYPAIAGVEVGKPFMEEYLAIDSEDDYLIYAAESEVVVHDDDDDVEKYDVRRLANLKEKTYLSPNSQYFHEYNIFVYNVNVVLRELTNVGSPEGMILGNLTIPYDGEITTMSVNMTVNMEYIPETVIPAKVYSPSVDRASIIIEVFLPELTWVIDGVPTDRDYMPGDNVQIQVSVKVPFFHDLFPEDTPVPVPGVDEVAFPEYFDVSDLPVADAGEDQTVYVGEGFLLDGSLSTGDIVSHTWTYLVDGVETVLGTGVSITTPILAEGVYVVTLTVESADYLTDIDTVVITVEAIVAEAGEDQTVYVGEDFLLDGSLSTGDIVSYTWTYLVDDVETVLGTGVSITTPILAEGVYVVTLTINDLYGETATDTVVITVEALVANAGSDQTVCVNNYVTLDGSLSTGDIVSYTWTYLVDGVETVLGTGVSITTPILAEGVYVVTLTIADAEGHTASDDVTITVLPMAPVG